MRLHWDTVKTLEMKFTRAKLAHIGTPGPKVIGIDEISSRKGHTYRIVASNLIRRRSIWYWGAVRKEPSMALFSDWLGETRASQNRLKSTTRFREALLDE